jgi:hypothetical protein
MWKIKNEGAIYYERGSGLFNGKQGILFGNNQRRSATCSADGIRNGI